MPEREPVTKTMKASEARQQFSQAINQVFRGETRVLVEKSGIPVAAIISARDLEQLRIAERQRSQDFAALNPSWRAFEGVSPAEVEREVPKAVTAARRKIRAERRGAATAP